MAGNIEHTAVLPVLNGMVTIGIKYRIDDPDFPEDVEIITVRVVSYEEDSEELRHICTLDHTEDGPRNIG